MSRMKAADKELYRRHRIDPSLPRNKRVGDAQYLVVIANSDRGTYPEFRERSEKWFAPHLNEWELCKACRHGWRCHEHPTYQAVHEQFLLSELRRLEQ